MIINHEDLETQCHVLRKNKYLPKPDSVELVSTPTAIYKYIVIQHTHDVNAYIYYFSFSVLLWTPVQGRPVRGEERGWGWREGE